MGPKRSPPGSWEGRFSTEEYEAVMEQKRDTALTVDWENGQSDVLPGAEIYKLVFDNNQPWMLSSNGTILQQNTKVLFRTTETLV